ncbi:MAG: TlpA family protein disulfide reductase [Bacteroidia bacterium]|nr:TlpA family protein disulfide reductase [Bacteroidia bacterium]
MFCKYFLFGLTAFLLFGCQSKPKAQQSQSSPKDATAIEIKQKAKSPVAHLKKPKSNDPYPYDIELKRPDGSIVASSDVLDFKDGPTVITFWLTTCYPCRLELKAIKEKFEGWQKEADFKFVAISTDFEKNYPSFVKMVNDSNWPWEAYNDFNRDFWEVMPGGLNGLPQVFVFDENGEIVYHKRKYKSGDEDILFEKIKSLQ